MIKLKSMAKSLPPIFLALMLILNLDRVYDKFIKETL